MNYQNFLDRINDDAISAAVRRVEGTTSGEVCVCISRRKTRDAMATALKLFRKFQLDHTARRNGVLILIAPRSQATAICGDEGIDQVCGSALWGDVIQLLGRELPEDPTRAIVDAVEAVGRELSRHFPRESDDVNELPDSPRYD